MRQNVPCDLREMQSQLKVLEYLALEQQEQLSQELGVDFTRNASEFIAVNSGGGCNHHYKHIDDAARAITTDVHQKSSAETVRLFLRLVIIKAILLTITKRLSAPLPATLAANQFRHFDRILSGKSMRDDWLDIDADLFQKEFGLASERLFAAGSQLLDKNCGIPRSIIFKDGLVKALASFLFLAKLSGFKPFIQIHTHTFNLDKFNESGWDECYQGCVELYEMFPELLGVFGSSWFYDPTVAEISPRLKYLQTIPASGGAKFLYYSAGGAAIGNATSTSESRKKMYEEGRYAPKSYMMIWGKKSQAKWVGDLGYEVKNSRN